MSIYQTVIDPTSTDQLLNNLSNAIEETKLVRTIQHLQENIYKLDSDKTTPLRLKFLHQEVHKLENQLQKIRERTIADF
jgi:hypothetical protein